MLVGGRVVEQAIEQIAAGAGSVIVPERSFGENYWAKVRTFERSMYLGSLEWPRFFSYDLFEALGGYDEDLIAMEDTDLGLPRKHPCISRQDVGCVPPRRGRADLPRGMPQEGPVRDQDSLPSAASTEAERWRRISGARTSSTPSLLLAQPTLGLGVLALKGGEAAAVAGRLLLDMAWKPERRVTADPARIK